MSMARKVVTATEYIDDLDGTSATGTVLFGYEGTSYEIELSRSNAAAFEKAIALYIGHARRVTPSRRRGSSRRGVEPDLAAVRQWAQAHGYQVSQRGRVAREVLDAYRAAH